MLCWFLFVLSSFRLSAAVPASEGAGALFCFSSPVHAFFPIFSLAHRENRVRFVDSVSTRTPSPRSCSGKRAGSKSVQEERARQHHTHGRSSGKASSFFRRSSTPLRRCRRSKKMKKKPTKTCRGKGKDPHTQTASLSLSESNAPSTVSQLIRGIRRLEEKERSTPKKGNIICRRLRFAVFFLAAAAACSLPLSHSSTHPAGATRRRLLVGRGVGGLVPVVGQAAVRVTDLAPARGQRRVRLFAGRHFKEN